MSTKIPIPAEVASFPKGTVIDEQFEVVSLLGHGGTGFVLKAIDHKNQDRLVALKFLSPKFAKDKTLLARFYNEVRTAQKLDHPSIVELYDVRESNSGYHYISMEFVEGESLTKIIYADSPLTFLEIRCIFEQIVKGITHAHAHDIIHRDLKPDNVIVKADKSAKLTDFGVAKSLTAGLDLTKTGEGLGTINYMAPEQLSAKKADHRADIYSLGILGFEMAERRRPFEHKTWVGLAAMHIRDPLPSLTNAEVPSWFSKLLQKAASKDVDERFQSGNEILTVLDKQAHAVGGSTERRSLAGLLLGIIVLIVAGVLFLIFGKNRTF